MSLTHSEAPGNILIPTRVAIYCYSDIQHVIIGSTTLATGQNILLAAVVPDGFLQVYTNIAMQYQGTAANVSINAAILSGAVYYYLWMVAPIVTGIIYDRQGLWILKPGDQLAFIINGATLNDDAYLWANGHSVGLV